VVVENPTLNEVLANPESVAGRPVATLAALFAANAAVAATLTSELLKVPVPTDAPYGLMTPEEAAEYLKVKVTWVRDKARAGVIPFTRLCGYMRFQREDIEALARNGCEQEGDLRPGLAGAMDATVKTKAIGRGARSLTKGEAR
jgi:excisionase family DNA binding protein